jgi:hypothetical protein
VGQGEARRGEAGPGKGTAWQGMVRHGKGSILMEAGAMKQFLSFIVDSELLRRIDDFRFRWRFGSRADAIRWLLSWALQRDPPVE